MTKYNKYRTAYWSEIDLDWYLIPRGRSKPSLFRRISPDVTYLLPNASDAQADSITPKYREILLGAIERNMLIEMWVTVKEHINEVSMLEADVYMRRGLGDVWGD